MNEPRPVLPPAPSVLIVLLGSLGDIVRALPTVSLLKQHRPDSHIAWAVDWRWSGLLRGHPAIDRLICFPRLRSPRALASFLGEIRSERVDLVLDLQRHLKSGICSAVSGAPRRIGFHPADTREGNHYFNTEHIARQSQRLSKLRHYLVFAEHLGISVPLSLDFGLGRLADRNRLPAVLAERDSAFVVLVMGSSWRSKDWSLDGYRALVARLERDTPFDVVLVGDSSQRDLAETLARTSGGSGRVVNLAGQTTLPELCSTLGAARVAVGPDSGPGHVAAALGTPYVTLFGPTVPERVAPYGCEHLAVHSPVDCEPCLRRTCHRRAGRCMDAITADMVWDVLMPLLQHPARPLLM